MIWATKVALACVIAFFAFMGIGFMVGAMAGWTYSSRDKVCATIPRGSTYVTTCLYGWEPPTEAFIQ